MYMSTSIYFVTKLREILIIAEVNGDGGYTPGYNSTSTEAFTADMFIYISICVVLSSLGFLGVVIINKMRSRPIQKKKVAWYINTDDIMVIKPMIHTHAGRLPE